MRYVRQVSLPVGTRVVLRVRVEGGLSDVLGVLEDAPAGVLAVRRRDGERVEVAETDVVAAKQVPPPPERRR